MDASELLGADGQATIFDVSSGRVIDGAVIKDRFEKSKRRRYAEWQSEERTASTKSTSSFSSRLRLGLILAVCMAGPPTGAIVAFWTFGPQAKPILTKAAAQQPPAPRDAALLTDPSPSVETQKFAAASQSAGFPEFKLSSLPATAPTIASEPLDRAEDTRPPLYPNLPEDNQRKLEQEIPAQPLIIAATPVVSVATAVCSATKIDPIPVQGGRTRFSVVSPCRKGEKVTINYAGFSQSGRLNDEGIREFEVDLFAGDQTIVEFVFEDGERMSRLPVTNDIDQVSKVAIVWNGPVNLDLHAFEYSSRIGDNGHVWAGAPSSYEDALRTVRRIRKGQGFLSSQSSGIDDGDHAEVYTFLLDDDQKNGVIETAIHYATRGAIPHGETCDDRRYASVKFKVFLTVRGQLSEMVTRQFSSVPCGVALARDQLLVRNSVQRLDRRQAALLVEH